MQLRHGDPDIAKDRTAMLERGKCGNCGQWGKCLFDMPRYGGFKGQGKRYVPYTLITDKVESENAKQDFCTCETFVENMQDRMLEGQAQRAAGRKGAELVSLLVGAKTITQGMEMGFNGRGEIIKPQPNIVDDLRRSGHKVNLDDQSLPVAFKIVEFERTIPDYNAPTFTRSDYSAKIAAMQAEQDQGELDAERELWERARARQPEKNAAASARGTAAAQALAIEAADEPAAVAEPEGKKK